jgi:hypothetical protein
LSCPRLSSYFKKDEWNVLPVTLVVSTKQKVADGIISALDDHDFVFGRFMELSQCLGCEC